MVTRFYLDQSELDDADVGLGGPSPAFVLDTSTLDGNGVLDGTNFTTIGTGASSLGGLVASATGTVTPVVSGVADAPLGELFADVSEVTIEDFGDGVAELGGLSASAAGGVTIVASASAGLGEASSSATGTLTVVGSATAVLGGVDASAVGVASEIGTASGGLGGLTASAVGTVTPQPQPEPEPTGGGQPYPYRRPKPRKKVEAVVVEVEDEVVVVPAVVEAYCTPIFAAVSASAGGRITFSAEEDDLQVMLML